MDAIKNNIFVRIIFTIILWVIILFVLLLIVTGLVKNHILLTILYTFSIVLSFLIAVAIKDNVFKDAIQKSEEKELSLAEERQQMLESYSAGKDLPSITDEDMLVLQSNETCYYSEEATVQRSDNEVVGYYERETIFLHNRIGNTITESKVSKVEGNLFITSKKIVFMADEESFVIKLDNLVARKVYKDALTIQSEQGAFSVWIDDPELANAIITGALKNNSIKKSKTKVKRK